MKVHFSAPCALTAGCVVTVQPVMPVGSEPGQAADTKPVKAAVESFTNSVDSGCVPLLVAVSVYCSVSPGLAFTLVAAGSAWVTLLTSLDSERSPAWPTVVMSVASKVVTASAGEELV